MRVIGSAGLLFLAGLLPVTGAADEKPQDPGTGLVQTLSQATYKLMDAARKNFEAKDYKASEATLEPIRTGPPFDKLNDFEKATLWNLLAAIYRAEDDNKRAIGAYLNVLKQNNLPDVTRNDALFALGQTYFVNDEFANAIKVLNHWFSLAVNPQPEAYILLAEAYYQQDDFAAAKAPALKAFDIAKQRNLPLTENWLRLIQAACFESRDYANAAEVTEALVSQYLNDRYLLQLAGLYGLRGDPKRQVEVMHVAYLGGYVTNPVDILNLARLYMARKAPQRAVDLMTSRIRDKTLPVDEETLQLLAQAMSLAKDTDQAIPVLTQLAALTGEAEHFVDLGQAYMQNDDWAKASKAFETALKSKDVTNPDSIRMQLGTALYNDKQLAPARETFMAVSAESPDHESAANWVRFLSTEIDRDNSLRARAG